MITILSFTQPIPSLARLAPLAAVVLAVAMASANGQQSFKTADEAVGALMSAAKAGDRQAVLSVLGRDGATIASSGDRVADRSPPNPIIEASDAKHQVLLT